MNFLTSIIILVFLSGCATVRCGNSPEQTLFLPKYIGGSITCDLKKSKAVAEDWDSIDEGEF